MNMEKKDMEEFKQELINDGINPEDIFNTDDLIQDSLENEYVTLCEQIPLEKLTPKEQYVVVKCKTRTTLSTEEISQLQEVIGRYQEAIIKHNPLETIQTYKENKEIVQSEKTFLELLKEQKREEKILTMEYPLNDGTTRPVTLTVLRADSSLINDVQKDLGLFKDFTPLEQRVEQKQRLGQPLTSEEIDILEDINRKINEQVNENPSEVLIEFLARTTRIKDEPSSDYNYMKQVYQTMDFYILEPLSKKVMVMSGVVTPNADELFH